MTPSEGGDRIPPTSGDVSLRVTSNRAGDRSCAINWLIVALATATRWLQRSSPEPVPRADRVVRLALDRQRDLQCRDTGAPPSGRSRSIAVAVSYDGRVGNALEALIKRWRDDPGATYQSWFLWEERLKNFRS